MNKIHFINVRYKRDSPSFYGLNRNESKRAHTSEVRGRLLSNCVKVTSSLFPDLAKGLADLHSKLQLDTPIDCFIQADPTMQAVCHYHEADKLNAYSVVLSSGLIERLNIHEIRFIIGHEVGHFLYKHQVHPSAQDFDSLGDKLAALELSRAAEISADRVGMLACESTEVACSAMIKVASGLGSEHVRCDVPSLLEQFREICASKSSQASIWDTHPIIPLRVRALLHFEPTLKQIKSNGSVDLARADMAVERDFMKTTNRVLDSISEEALAKMVKWGLMSLFVADGVLTKNEQEVMKDQLGDVSAQKILTYLHSQNGSILDIVDSRLIDAARAAQIAPRAQRIRLYKHFEVLVTEASGGEPAMEALHTIKKLLD